MLEANGLKLTDEKAEKPAGDKPAAANPAPPPAGDAPPKPSA
jgi:hypothetical protein